MIKKSMPGSLYYNMFNFLNKLAYKNQLSKAVHDPSAAGMPGSNIRFNTFKPDDRHSSFGNSLSGNKISLFEKKQQPYFDASLFKVMMDNCRHDVIAINQTLTAQTADSTPDVTGLFKISDEEFLLRKRKIVEEYNMEIQSFEKEFEKNGGLDTRENLSILLNILKKHRAKMRRLTFWFNNGSTVANTIIVITITILIVYIKAIGTLS